MVKIIVKRGLFTKQPYPEVRHFLICTKCCKTDEVKISSVIREKHVDVHKNIIVIDRSTIMEENVGTLNLIQEESNPCFPNSMLMWVMLSEASDRSLTLTDGDGEGLW